VAYKGSDFQDKGFGFRGWDSLDIDRLVGFREGCCVRQPERSLSVGMNVVAKVRQVTRRKDATEGKIQIILEGLRGENPISELCRRERILERREKLKWDTLSRRKMFSHRPQGPDGAKLYFKSAPKIAIPPDDVQFFYKG
jgi:transposase